MIWCRAIIGHYQMKKKCPDLAVPNMTGAGRLPTPAALVHCRLRCMLEAPRTERICER